MEVESSWAERGRMVRKAARRYGVTRRQREGIESRERSRARPRPTPSALILASSPFESCSLPTCLLVHSLSHSTAPSTSTSPVASRRCRPSSREHSEPFVIMGLLSFVMRYTSFIAGCMVMLGVGMFSALRVCEKPIPCPGISVELSNSLAPPLCPSFLGSGYSFGAYSQKLAAMLDFSQSQINLVPSLGGIGVYLGASTNLPLWLAGSSKPHLLRPLLLLSPVCASLTRVFLVLYCRRDCQWRADG